MISLWDLLLIIFFGGGGEGGVFVLSCHVPPLSPILFCLHLFHLLLLCLSFYLYLPSSLSHLFLFPNLTLAFPASIPSSLAPLKAYPAKRSIEWFIESQAFLWFRYRPIPSSPSSVSNFSLFLSLPVCRRSSLLKGEGGRGRAEPSIMHSVLSAHPPPPALSRYSAVEKFSLLPLAHAAVLVMNITG
jgi:hypothetical protein